MRRVVERSAVAALVAAALAAAFVLGSTTDAQPPAARGQGPRRTLELPVLVEVNGSSGAAGASRPTAADIEVTVDGAKVAVSELRTIAAGNWQVVVYFDALAATHEELERGAAALEAAKSELTALGPVTILVADTLVEPWIEDSTDLDEIQSAFAELSEATFEPPASRGGDFTASRRSMLLGQIARRPWGSGARALIVVGDANAERSSGSGAAKSGAASGGTEDDPRAPARRGELAAAVASLGWVAVPLHFAGEGSLAVSPLAEETGGEAVTRAADLPAALARLAARMLLRVEAPVADQAVTSLSIASSTATLRAARFVATRTPDFVLAARIDALLSGETEGDLDVMASAQLDSDAAGTPELAVEVLAESPAGSAAAGRFAGPSSRLRASFVLGRVEEEPIVIHHQGEGGSLDGAGAWLLQARLDVPQDLEGVAVVVEDSATGKWGAVIAEVDGEDVEVTSSGRVATEVADLRAKAVPTARGAAPAGAPTKAADASLVRLVPPRARELIGVQTFRAMALNAFIERVVFVLDGKQVDEDKDDPFAGHIDLGSELRQHEVRAIAYDNAGRELGRDTVVVNKPRTSFGVRIVEIKGGRGSAGDGTLARSPAGAAPPQPVEVTADVSVPPRQRVERVEVYWNENLGATLQAPPWKASLGQRQSTGGDYVRVVAYLEDGQSLEDVQLVGASGSIERVEVNLVEIFTVVLDRAGTPVGDLKQEEVSVRLAGKPVGIERFGVAEDLPLDIGLVIDTSQSMEVLMDDTRNAAIRFIADLMRSKDRAFLVDFDTKPRLAHPMTENTMDLVKSMASLRADGNTAIFDSIVFSLLHFEEGEDRRAIVLLTDGEDYKSKFSDRQASLQARAAGVPVYILSLAGMDWLRPSLKKDDLERIAQQTGGHVFYVSARPELDTAYARIGAELRSQYVLAFATEKPLTESELAKLEVRVSRPDTSVRAVVSGRSIQTR